MGRVVLVTGVSRDLGRRFARSIAADPEVDKVVGVDAVPPRGDIGEVSFHRADIRNPIIAKVLAKEDVDTVVHMSVISTPGRAGGRGTMKELNVIGTMQLLAACQKSAGVQHLVVKSTTTVYGASSRDPALFTEDQSARRLPKSGYAKDAAEVEGYVRGFTRRRPDVRTTLLRAANVIGPHVESPITAYLRLPVVPTVLGFDPRLTFLHERDLLAVMRLSALADIPGTFNVAGDGVIKLSQALRRLGKPSVPVPSFALGQLGPALRRAHVAELSRDLIELLTYGRGIDTTRMHNDLGFSPRYSSAEALADFGATLAGIGRPDERLVAAVSALSGVDDAPAHPQEVQRG